MFAICIESSHQRGMGHLYRALNFFEVLKAKNEKYLLLVNDDEVAGQVFKSKNVTFEVVALTDYESDWESRIIEKHSIDIWLNDRLNTDYRHANNVKKNKVKLITFDDNGSGSDLADLNVKALAFSIHRSSNRTLAGIDYLILNKEINKYKRLRRKAGRVIVSLGGSDTYGVTIQVIEILQELGIPADIHFGPSFSHHEALDKALDVRYRKLGIVPSLIETFHGYDLAITGGGMTSFEANASGLPCIIIANELFEIPNGELLHNLGCSVFAGYHERLNKSIFKQRLDIERMSRIGMDSIGLNGAENVYREIKVL